MNGPTYRPRSSTKKGKQPPGRFSWTDPRFLEERLYDEAYGPTNPGSVPLWVDRPFSRDREWEDPYAFIDVKVDAGRETRSERLAHFGFTWGLRPVGATSSAHLFREEKLGDIPDVYIAQRGRPKGSKNKEKIVLHPYDTPAMRVLASMVMT